MKLRIGTVEGSFLALFLSWILLGYLTDSPTLGLILGLAMLVTGAWSAIRLSRVFVRQLLWRLRNRLIVAYIFIALVPVVLITLLIQVGIMLAGGQLAIYLVSTELSQRLKSLETSAALVRNSADAKSAQDYLGALYPRLSLGPGLLPTDWKPGNGVVKRDGALYGWARAGQTDALFPITREFLGDLVPDMCESTIVEMPQGQVLLAPSSPDAPESHNRLPPATRFFDFEIRWGTPLALQNGQDAGSGESLWLTIRTRPSALFQTFLEQGVSWASDFIPIFFLSVAIAFLFAEVISLIIGVSLTRTITGAIHDLYEGTLRVRANDFSYKIPIQSRDQLGELAVSFNQMTENVQRLLVVEKERERLQAELEIAREVQSQLYPRTMPDVQTLGLTATCNPARMVSGDYYDYQQIGDGKVALAIGDVAGKGISAALLMATVQSSFRSQIRGSLELAVSAGQEHTSRLQVSTSQMVTHLNQQLFADTSPEKYATLYLGMYDEASSKLTYTNAGHLPPILVRDGKAERLEVNGMVVGAFPFARYNESEITLQQGDLVCFFTDGVTEPENAYGEMFSEEQLIDLLLRNADKSEREIIDCILESVQDWTGAGELQDDMTLLLVRRR